MSTRSLDDGFECRRITKELMPTHLPAVKALFVEYTQGLLAVGCNVDLFQGFSKELAELPGKYAEERGGCMFLVVQSTPDARDVATIPKVMVDSATPPDERKLDTAPTEGSFVLPTGEETCACIALRRLDDTTCEVKRLYVRDKFRGNRLGKRLTAKVLEVAADAGYSRAVLDTLERLPAAVRLYTSLGFKRIEAYCYNPLEDVVFMGTDLPWSQRIKSKAAPDAATHDAAVAPSSVVAAAAAPEN